MNAFEKAVALLEEQRAANNCYPSELSLVKYSPKQFKRLRPGENYEDHLRQREAIVAYAESKGIFVKDVRPHRHPDEVERARIAARPPYRLGLEMGGGSLPGGASGGSVSHFAIWLRDPNLPPAKGGRR